MRRRNFVKMAGILATMPALKSMASPSEEGAAKEKEIYEWRHYTLTADGSKLDNFYQKVLIPAYNRKNIKVGAFKLYEPKDAEQRFYLFVYPNITTYYKVKKDIWKDSAFMKEAKPFFDESAPKPVYTEFDSYLCEAFDKIPQMKTPDKNRTLFHLRHYHSPNEEANQRKVKMFNDGEIAVFDKVGVNPVCYGEMISGPHMPALMYLTWYKDKATHDAAWDKFKVHPEWLAMRGLPEYANTANNNTNRLLSPMDYSQI